MLKGVPKNLKRPSDRSRHVDLLFSAYQGLVWYVEWLSIKQKAEYLEALEEGNCLFCTLDKQSLKGVYRSLIPSNTVPYLFWGKPKPNSNSHVFDLENGIIMPKSCCVHGCMAKQT